MLQHVTWPLAMTFLVLWQSHVRPINAQVVSTIEWLSIRENILKPQLGNCNEKAGEWIRTALNDAGTYSAVDFDQGGADGSVQFELDRPENQGLEETISYFNELVAPGISMADLIALGGALAVQVCGGPPIPFRPGRIDAVGPNPAGRILSPGASLLEVLAAYSKMQLTDKDAIAITGGARTARVTGDGKSFDSTPDEFDNLFFLQLLIPVKPDKIITHASDEAFLTDPVSRMTIESYANNDALFLVDFQAAFGKMINFNTFGEASIQEGSAGTSGLLPLVASGTPLPDLNPRLPEPTLNPDIGDDTEDPVVSVIETDTNGIPIGLEKVHLSVIKARENAIPNCIPKPYNSYGYA